MKLSTTIKTFELNDEAGQKILSAPLMDLYYLIGNAYNTVPTQTPDEDGELLTDDEWRFAHVASTINKRYRCNLSWGNIAEFVTAVEDAVASIKKNGSIPESGKGS